MTKSKNLKTVSTAAAANRIAGTGRTAAVGQKRQPTKAEAPKDIDMDVLADKIAARMGGASPACLSQGAANAVQTSSDTYSGARALSASFEDKAPSSPIDSALADLQNALSELDNQSNLLIQAIDPVLLYNYDEEGNKLEAGQTPVTLVSPMHNRIISLTDQVNALAARINNARNRVQL